MDKRVFEQCANYLTPADFAAPDRNRL